MVEMAGVLAGVVVGGWLAEVGRRAVLGGRLQRSMGVPPTPATAGREAGAVSSR